MWPVRLDAFLLAGSLFIRVNKARQELKMSLKRVNEIKQTFHP
jgi:hypothetical protein